LHQTCKKLAGEGININTTFFSACGAGPATIVLAVDQPEKAKSSLDKELAAAAR